MDEQASTVFAPFICPCGDAAVVWSAKWTCGAIVLQAECAQGHAAQAQSGYGCKNHPHPYVYEFYPGLLAAALEAIQWREDVALH